VGKAHGIVQPVNDSSVEVVQRAVEAFNARDRDGFRACFGEAPEIFPLRHPVDGTVFSGPCAVADYLDAVDDVWETIHWGFVEYRAVAGGVLMLGALHGVGRGTGVPVDTDGGVLAILRDGLIHRLQVFSDRDDALAAADGIG
jgi:ketosteroid isomerase-like protein